MGSLQSIMGHSRIEITLQYAKMTDTLVASQHHRFSPMADISQADVTTVCENYENERMLSPDSHQGKSASTRVLSIPPASVEEFEMILALSRPQQEKILHLCRRQTARPAEIENARGRSTLAKVYDLIKR